MILTKMHWIGAIIWHLQFRYLPLQRGLFEDADCDIMMIFFCLHQVSLCFEAIRHPYVARIGSNLLGNVLSVP